MYTNITILFLIFLTAGLIIQFWLYYRHGKHVAAHRNAVPEAFAEKIALAAHQKAADYTLAKIQLGRVELILSALILLGWTLGGGLDIVFSFWKNTSIPSIIAESLAIFTIMFIGMFLDLPLSIWRTFRLEQQFGFNRTTMGMFFIDLAKNILFSLILGVPLILVILWLMEQAGSMWWLYAWGVWTGFTLFMIWAFPTLIAPMFNKFTPLEAGDLRTRIEALLERCGFKAAEVFMMDNSKRSSHGNAYFTGLGRTKRIVLFDTLVDSLKVTELEAVLAHELGHYKHRHIQIRLLMVLMVTFIGFAILGWLVEQAWFYNDFGVSQRSNGAALMLFMFVIPVFSQFLEPLNAWLLRQHEYQADAFAIAQTDGVSLINALVKLYKDNAGTLTPDPLFSAFYDSHPPAPLRIRHIKQHTLKTA